MRCIYCNKQASSSTGVRRMSEGAYRVSTAMRSNLHSLSLQRPPQRPRAHPHRGDAKATRDRQQLVQQQRLQAVSNRPGRLPGPRMLGRVVRQPRSPLQEANPMIVLTPSMHEVQQISGTKERWVSKHLTAVSVLSVRSTRSTLP